MRKRGQRGGKKVTAPTQRSVNPKNLILRVTSNKSRNDIDISFLLSNVQYIKSKEYLLRHKLDKISADFAVITETWLSASDSTWTDCCQFNTDGYKIVTANRSDS